MLQTTVLLALAGLATAAINMEVHEKYLSLPREEFIEYFNSQNYTFKIKHYDHLEGMQLTGAISTANISHVRKVRHDREQYHYLPDNFDSRTTWPNCPSISEIYDQGPNCGSCWAFGTGTVISDRTCIHTGAPVRISEQDYVCLNPNVCGGGKGLDAFTYWVNYGFVTLNCLPYDAQALLDRKVSCDLKCTNNIDYYSDKHYGDIVYGLEVDDYNLRSEIVLNGPVQASFDVFADFKQYKSGVYIHTFGEIIGKHSVRVLGFGVENGIDYWLVANSWGSNWGINGIFKIQRFQGGLKFEDEFLTGLPWN